MALIYDIHPKNTPNEPTRIVREIFDTSHDIIEWAHKEEIKIEKAHLAQEDQRHHPLSPPHKHHIHSTSPLLQLVSL